MSDAKPGEAAQATPAITVPKAPDAKGTVSADNGAGKAKATMLMIGEARQTATAVAAMAARALGGGLGGAAVVLQAGEAGVDFAALDRFTAAEGQVAALLRAAGPAPASAMEMTKAISPVPAVNLGAQIVEGAAKLAQHLALKRSFAGVEVAATDQMLVIDVARADRSRRGRGRAGGDGRGRRGPGGDRGAAGRARRAGGGGCGR